MIYASLSQLATLRNGNNDGAVAQTWDFKAKMAWLLLRFSL